jgi:hypothetical protein
MCGSLRIPAKSALQPLSSYNSLSSTCLFAGTTVSLGPVQVRIPKVYMFFHMHSNFTTACAKSLFLGTPISLDSISTQDTPSYMCFFPCPTEYISWNRVHLNRTSYRVQQTSCHTNLSDHSPNSKKHLTLNIPLLQQLLMVGVQCRRGSSCSLGNQQHPSLHGTAFPSLLSF